MGRIEAGQQTGSDKTAIRPFHVNVSKAELSELRARIKSAADRMSPSCRTIVTMMTDLECLVVIVARSLSMCRRLPACASVMLRRAVAVQAARDEERDRGRQTHV